MQHFQKLLKDNQILQDHKVVDIIVVVLVDLEIADTMLILSPELCYNPSHKMKVMECKVVLIQEVEIIYSEHKGPDLRYPNILIN